MFRVEIIDCLKYMNRIKNQYFDVTSFSPPYGVNAFFDVRKDFEKVTDKFYTYFTEIGRVSKVVGVNFTQLVDPKTKGQNLFLEQVIINSDELGMKLLDRWVLIKPTCRPQRGNKVLNNFEFFFVFCGKDVEPSSIQAKNPGNFKTAFNVNTHNKNVIETTGTMPYFSEIPKQLFSVYGKKNCFDPFCGSGTSLVEGLKLGLEAFGCEVISDIAKVARANCKSVC